MMGYYPLESVTRRSEATPASFLSSTTAQLLDLQSFEAVAVCSKSNLTDAAFAVANELADTTTTATTTVAATTTTNSGNRHSLHRIEELTGNLCAEPQAHLHQQQPELADNLVRSYQSSEDDSNLEEEFAQDIETNATHPLESGNIKGSKGVAACDATIPVTSPAINGGSLDMKQLFEELCPVCGDKVSGYHYGLLTCESCKGFFKRTVQNKKIYTCVAERSCYIDKTQRKRCPYCRFEKCLEVGMKLEAVRADRMRGGRNMFGPMYKRNRARKLQAMRQRQLALQALRSSVGSETRLVKPTHFPSIVEQANPKQDIQIAQVSSLTPWTDADPSPSPLFVGYAFDNNNMSGAQSLGRASPMVRGFIEAQSIDDREWQTQLFALLQKQSYNQVQVDLFELMCKVLDQNLFSQVDWARNSAFFKDLPVDDQMKLLQHSWSDMLVLDHLHHRMHNALPDETQLHNGQMFDLLGLGVLGVSQLRDHFIELQHKLMDLKCDVGEYVCLKFLILLNPQFQAVNIADIKTVQEGHESVQAALLDHTLVCHPSINGKFARLLSIIQDIRAVASRGQEYLLSKHCAGNAPTQTLLMEMLNAKRKV